jgi:Tol biopolymer transport system component
MTLLLALLLCGQVPGSVNIDPRLHWYTLETDHFAVHLPLRGKPAPESLELPRRVAALAEEVHSTLCPAAGWTPAGRTDIVVAGFFDYLNGWATPFPSNTITIIPTPEPGSRTNDDDWLRTLILHEYTHILQTDMAAAIPLDLRRVFGRVCLPNAIAPAWLNEGYAVYCETRYTGFGRLRSAEYDAMIRAAADAHSLLPVDRCAGYELRRFPAGNASYVYGSMFQAHIARADSDAGRRYNLTRSRSIPFIENYQARRALGRSVNGIWHDWQARARTRAESVRSALGSTTPMRQVTREGFHTSAPCWSSDGSEVYFVSRTGAEYPAIKAVDTATGATRPVHRGPLNPSLSLSRDGRWVVFSEQHHFRNYYDYDDLFWLDLTTGAVRRLTDGRRARDPDFAPDTTLLAFVATAADRTELCLLDYHSGGTSVMADGTDGAVYHRPRFSPSGKWLAVGIQRPGGYSDIELVDRRSGWTMPVTHDRANDISPCWSRTGKFLFFVSDRTGVYNLFAYQLATGKLFQCTNSLYGVFEPAVSPDNRRIAVVSRSAAGDDISLLDFRAADWQEAKEFSDTMPETLRPDSAVQATLYYFNPFPSLWPKFWLPVPFDGSSWTAGAFTMGWDALQRHSYSVIAGWRFADATPFTSLSYGYRGFGPSLSLAVDADLHTQQALAGAGFTWRTTYHTNWLDLSAGLGHDSLFDSRLDADWTFSDAFRYRYCVAPVQGRITGLHLDAKAGALLAQQDRIRLLGTYVHYFGNPPQDWTLRCHAAYGTAFGDQSAGRAWLLSSSSILGVRGSSDTLPGRSLLTAGAQFRKPLWWIERGIGTAPVFLQNINAALFAEAGLAAAAFAPTGSELRRTSAGVGCELRADLVLLHLVPASVSVGVAAGLNPTRNLQVYAGVQSDLVSGLFRKADPDRNLLRRLPDAELRPTQP